MGKKITVQEAIEVLRESGIQVDLNHFRYTKKTFEIETEVLNRFINRVKSNKLRMKDCVTEALSDWLKKSF